jgi:AcrR family transcriptional regulator
MILPVYRYFKDKKSLFLAVYEQGINELRQKFTTSVLPVTDPSSKIAAAVRTYFEFFENNRELIEIQAQLRSEFRDDYRRMFLELYHDYVAKIQENLCNGIRAGLFRQMDVEKTANAISASLQGILESFYMREFGTETTAADSERGTAIDSRPLTGRVEAVTTLLLEGLLKRDGEKD